MERIDTARQTFRSAFTVTQNWIWSKEDKESYQLSSKAQDDIENDSSSSTNHSKTKRHFSWQPSPLNFPNAIKETLEVIEGKPFLRKFNLLMMVEKKTHVYGDFGEKFELDSYPFDCQNFRISISWSDSEEICQI